jgi:hypothetical protein
MITFTFVLLALAALTCLACTVLLFRGYARSGMSLLLWSGLCFVFLTLNNLLLFFDLIVFPDSIDLRPWRLGAALIGLLFLLYGFIFESD